VVVVATLKIDVTYVEKSWTIVKSSLIIISNDLIMVMQIFQQSWLPV